MIYFCSQKNRRTLVLQHPTLNGIDFLEVSDADGDCGTLLVITLLKDGPNLMLSPSQVQITGGSSTAQVKAISVSAPTDAAPRVLGVRLNHTGDFSAYTLSLIADASTPDPPDGFDPQLSTVSFSFKAGCPTVSDCVPITCCPPDRTPQPDINYLAKDYDTFRQVMLDRMAVLAPEWKESHPSDIGIALVELLAYAADHLSYQQDAIGTEAYLGTARSRISLRRHAKLVDYKIDEGSNARAWVYMKVSKNVVSIPCGTLVLPRLTGLPTRARLDSAEAAELLNGSTVVFATMRDSTLYDEQNCMYFYTWGDSNCCLANGATEATLSGTLTTLLPRSVLIFEEVMGPNTGDPGDADPRKRWAVRLTAVQTTDQRNHTLLDPLNGEPITKIWWGPEDALPFPLCISSITDPEHQSRALPAVSRSSSRTPVSVARGNIIPADHGIWQHWDDLGEVPAASPAPVAETSCACKTRERSSPPRPRYLPQLARSPLTFAWPLDSSASATAFMAPPSSPAARPIPQICIRDDENQEWTVLDDLLSSDDSQRVCALEVERDGTVFVRFGDRQYGMAPEQGAHFYADYRVGNGASGNLGRDTLAHVITNAEGIDEVRNALPAAGGVDPETMEHIRQTAPFAFRTQLRAVTEDDYGAMAQDDPAIREARGTLRWTGSWYTAFVSVDTHAPCGPDLKLLAATKERLNLFRMAGVDLEVEAALLIGLRIEMNICVAPDHFQSDVRDAIMRVFTVGDICDGRRGILNPENFTFGQTIYTSPLIAAAQTVEGVSSATMSVFQRMDDPSVDGVALGYLTMGRLEIGRCDNDPNRLDHGIFILHMDGGK
jgi:Baseplate J-like protein